MKILIKLILMSFILSNCEYKYEEYEVSFNNLIEKHNEVKNEEFNEKLLKKNKSDAILYLRIVRISNETKTEVVHKTSVPIDGSLSTFSFGPKISFQTVVNHSVVRAYKNVGLNIHAKLIPIKIKNGNKNIIKLEMYFIDGHIINQVDLAVPISKTAPLLKLYQTYGKWIFNNNTELKIYEITEIKNVKPLKQGGGEKKIQKVELYARLVWDDIEFPKTSFVVQDVYNNMQVNISFLESNQNISIKKYQGYFYLDNDIEAIKKNNISVFPNSTFILKNGYKFEIETIQNNTIILRLVDSMTGFEIDNKYKDNLICLKYFKQNITHNPDMSQQSPPWINEFSGERFFSKYKTIKSPTEIAEFYDINSQKIGTLIIEEFQNVHKGK